MKKVLERFKILQDRINELEVMLEFIDIMLEEDIDKANRNRMKEEIQKLLNK